MLTSALVLTFFASQTVNDPLIVRFDRPAGHFTESCPVGNGRLGAMDFGGTSETRIALNENTMWSGWPQDQNRKEAWKHRPEILELLYAGKNPEAEALVNKYFTCDGPGSSQGNGKDGPFGCYQTLGNLLLTMPGPGVVFSNTPRPHSLGQVSGYGRSLDLKTAVSKTTYEFDGVTYTREVIASHPDQVIAIRLKASKKGALRFSARLRRGSESSRGDTQHQGTLGKGVSYLAKMQAVVDGVPAEFLAGTEGIRASNATEAILYISAGTDYNGPIKGDHFGKQYREKVQAKLKSAVKKGWKSILADHTKDYRGLFDKCTLSLPAAVDRDRVSTVKRMEAVSKGGTDPGFAALYFAYGRYLMISSSRNGGLPANLQGLWAEEEQTPWNGDYHININLQMNYWLVDQTNLSECQEPLTNLIESLVEPGTKTAKEYYNAPGWVAHVIANPWGFTEPGEDAGWGSTYSGGGWLCEHLFDHYAFSQDKAYLKRVFPALKGSADFYRSTLLRDPKSGAFVTGPSNSPENAFTLPDGRSAHTCLGPTIDSQIIRELLTNTREAGQVLGASGNDDVIYARTLANLSPSRVGPDGRLMEWLEPYGEPEPQHRHTSHLYGLHPSDEITRFGTPDLAAACRETLEKRGDQSTGWSMAWKVNFWARLGDGDRAYKLLRDLWKPVSEQGTDYSRGGGSYANLFCAHPPFQIDGNFGATAGIAEMLLQSHRERATEPYTVSILPALPKAWPEGLVKGLRARGGLEVSIEWESGHIEKCTIKRVAGSGLVRLRTPQTVFNTEAKSKLKIDAVERNILQFSLKKGESVTLAPSWE